VTQNLATDPRVFSKPPVDRWPSEIPLFILSVFLSIPIWIGLFVSLIGAAYLLFIGLFLFLVHLGFIAHVRGSGVRVGPQQLPRLHASAERLAGEMGLARMPAVYVVQAGGTLNALATKFLGSHMVVLFAELLDACGDDEAARDMIIAHELGHIRAGHLSWRWLTAPAMLIPLLGQALSRAREYTCDRYGVQGAGSVEGGVRGLIILAAGPQQAKHVNRTAFVQQDSDLQTGWMTIGQWFATHPPLARRVAAIDPALGAAVPRSSRGLVRAFAILGSVWLTAGMAGSLLLWKLPHWGANLFKPPETTGGLGVKGTPNGAGTTSLSEPSDDDPGKSQAGDEAAGESEHQEHGSQEIAWQAPPLGQAKRQAAEDFARIARLIDAERTAGRPIPWNDQMLQRLWTERERGPFPLDPFDGTPYGYDRNGPDYLLFSVGPDREVGTADDLLFDSRARGARAAPSFQQQPVRRVTAR